MFWRELHKYFIFALFETIFLTRGLQVFVLLSPCIFCSPYVPYVWQCVTIALRIDIKVREISLMGGVFRAHSHQGKKR